MKRCPGCDIEIKDGLKKCPYCGKIQETSFTTTDEDMQNLESLDLAQEIGALQKLISETETLIKEITGKRDSAIANRTVAYIAFIISVLGFLFLTGLWLLWVIILIIGFFFFFHAVGIINSGNFYILNLDKKLIEFKALLAEKQAINNVPSSKWPIMIDPTQRVKQLKKMQEAGFIGAEEYEAKKAEIIAKM
jgi:hypothetical protein